MNNSLAYMYHFTHKSGRKIIAQSDTEFFHMQMGKWGNNDKIPAYLRTGKDGKFEKDFWGGQQIRLGFQEWRAKGNANSEQYAFENKLNKFWEAAVGYEKLFPTDLTSKHRHSKLHTGYWGCSMKRFLAEVANHANMQGNLELYNKAQKALEWFRGNQLCLPAGN